MANTPRAATPTAPGVDPITPKPEADPAPIESFTSTPKAHEATKPTTPPPPAGNGATAELEMVTVRTKTPILLMDPFTARHIDNRKEGTEVPVSSFINDELAEGGRLEKA